MVRAAALASVVGFFGLLRISEFAGRDRYYMEPFILRRCDVTFYSKGKMCAWNHPGADAVELYIRGSKTDQRQQGCLLHLISIIAGSLTFSPDSSHRVI